MRLSVIEVANVVLSRIFGSLFIKAFKKLVLHRVYGGAFFEDVVAMKHVANKVTIIKCQIELRLDFGLNGFYPVGVVA